MLCSQNIIYCPSHRPDVSTLSPLIEMSPPFMQLNSHFSYITLINVPQYIFGGKCMRNSSCVQGVLLFPLHTARYEPVSTYLGPHSRRTHVPLVRHPPSLDIKANRNAPAIRRHRLAWENQAKWQYTRSNARTWPTLCQRCDSVDDNGQTLRQHCVLAICEMLFVQPVTQLYSVYSRIIQSNIATSDYKLNN